MRIIHYTNLIHNYDDFDHVHISEPSLLITIIIQGKTWIQSTYLWASTFTMQLVGPCTMIMHNVCSCRNENEKKMEKGKLKRRNANSPFLKMSSKSTKAFPPSCHFIQHCTEQREAEHTRQCVWVAQWARGSGRDVPELFSPPDYCFFHILVNYRTECDNTLRTLLSFVF